MDNECVICLEEMLDEVAVLSCGHKYHFSCLSEWCNSNVNSTYNKLCTICRDTDTEIVNVISKFDDIVTLEDNYNKNKNKTVLLKNNKISPYCEDQQEYQEYQEQPKTQNRYCVIL
jgi:hypothetical protein